MTRMAVRLPGQDRHRSRDEINHIAVTVNGSMADHLNRLPTGYRSTFRMTHLCASLTKPYIKLFWGEVLSDANG